MPRITGEEIAEYVQGARPDLANYVVHWTKMTWKRKDPDRLVCLDLVPDLNPLEVLRSILGERRIRASRLKIMGGTPVVCLSESPLWAMKHAYITAQFNQGTSTFDDHRYGKCLNYHPYGLLFSKCTIYRLGGRPVLYLSKPDQRLLPPSMQWRTHMFEAPGCPGTVDFTHEREWRCPSDVDLDKLAPSERPKAVVWAGDEREMLKALASRGDLPVSDVIALSELRS